MPNIPIYIHDPLRRYLIDRRQAAVKMHYLSQESTPRIYRIVKYKLVVIRCCGLAVCSKTSVKLPCHSAHPFPQPKSGRIFQIHFSQFICQTGENLVWSWYICDEEDLLRVRKIPAREAKHNEISFPSTDLPARLMCAHVNHNIRVESVESSANRISNSPKAVFSKGCPLPSAVNKSLISSFRPTRTRD